MLRRTPEQIGAQRVLNLPTFESGESVTKAATNWVTEDMSIEWKPICGDPNNRGSVEIVETDVQGLVELLTNSSDAYLVQYLDDVDSRQELLDNLNDDEEVLMEFTGQAGGGRSSEYSVIVADEGCGVERNEFEDAFLRDPSTGGVDKRKYKYLYGEFGQGSLASIGISKVGCKFVASSHKSNPKKWSWSVTRYNKDRKRYEYLTVNGSIPTFNGQLSVGEFGEMSFGTVTKVFDIDSTQTPKDVTSNPFIRRLGHAFPETAVPLNIVDKRKGSKRRRIWEGMKEELEKDHNVEEYTRTQNLDEYGEITLDAFVIDENVSFDNEFLNYQNRDRIFYTVYGMTHHTETYSALRSECNIKSIDEDIMLFVDCSNLDKPINDIFMPSRTGVKKGVESRTFLNQIYTILSGWDKIQQIDDERATISDILDTNGESPLQDISFGETDSPVPTFERNQFEESIDVVCDVEDYCEWDVVDTKMVGLQGDYSLSVSGNTINLSVDVEKDTTGTICVTDTEFGENLTQTFQVTTEDEDVEQDETHTKTAQEAQAHRATRGNDFEQKVVDKISDKVEYEVTKESNTPDSVISELRFDVSGVTVEPDTDIVIHDGEEPKGVVSCKRSLRERVGQTAFWKLFLEDKNVNIPIYLATLDPDDELTDGRKWRAVAEDVLNGVIVFDDDKEYFNENITSVASLSEVASVN